MMSLLSRLSRSRTPQANEPTTHAPSAASVETLEDRRLYSVSSGGEVSSFSWGVSQTGTLSYRLPAVQQPGETNIIAILIG